MTIYINYIDYNIIPKCKLCGKLSTTAIQSDKKRKGLLNVIFLCREHADELAKGKIEDLRK